MSRKPRTGAKRGQRLQPHARPRVLTLKILRGTLASDARPMPPTRRPRSMTRRRGIARRRSDSTPSACERAHASQLKVRALVALTFSLPARRLKVEHFQRAGRRRPRDGRFSEALRPP
jgi:hypothetical protein